MGNLRTRLIRIRKEEPPGPTITPQRSVVTGTPEAWRTCSTSYSDWKDALMPLHAHHLASSPPHRESVSVQQPWLPEQSCLPRANPSPERRPGSAERRAPSSESNRPGNPHPSGPARQRKPNRRCNGPTARDHSDQDEREFVGGSCQSSNSELFKQTIADCGSDEAGGTGNRYHGLGHDRLLCEDRLVG